jgi:hypothetical protein
VQQAPGIPCSLSLGEKVQQTSGAMRRENEDAHSVVIVREGGRSSIPETAVIELKSRGVLDTPHSRGMTTVRNVALAMTRMGRSTLDTRMCGISRAVRAAQNPSAGHDRDFANASHAHVKGPFRVQIDND